LTRHLLGLLAEWSGDFETAASLLDPTLQAALLSETPHEDLTPRLLRARELKGLAQTDAAYPLLTDILLSEPRNSEALWELAECLKIEGRHEESAWFFRAVCRINPTRAEAFYQQGLALLCARSPAAAIAPLYHVTSLKPHWHMPWRHLAMALIQNGQHPEAALALCVCCDLAPDDAVSLSQYILSLHYCAKPV
jgi:predicted Zn-dependent protease